VHVSLLIYYCACNFEFTASAKLTVVEKVARESSRHRTGFHVRVITSRGPWCNAYIHADKGGEGVHCWEPPGRTPVEILRPLGSRCLAMASTRWLLRRQSVKIARRFSCTVVCDDMMYVHRHSSPAHMQSVLFSRRPY